MGSIHDRRAAAARILAELDERALDAAEAVLTALRCQDRVRRLAVDGVMTSPSLLAVAFAEMPADVDLAVADPSPDVVARRCPTCRDVVVAGVCGCEDDVDRAVAEALVQELAFTTVTTTPAPAAIDDDMRPGEAVRVEVARGSKTGPIVEVGSFVGWERNERTGERMALVLVGGVVRRVERGKAWRG